MHFKRKNTEVLEDRSFYALIILFRLPSKMSFRVKITWELLEMILCARVSVFQQLRYTSLLGVQTVNHRCLFSSTK
jgi:hypothetical protein